ncbi:UDP-N-acetylmuramoyl-L-alanine--D-glutamate ligase, partial [bacterium]|nr:UDP-N-acetylmuramoyl-L-alanine--D-glutamate ligase [bacterium]
THPMLREAKKVLSEIEVAASLLKGKIIAITGSNGKTTTTTLIHKILEKAGLDTGIGGNISPPLMSLVQRNPEYVVAEISSFQLEWIEQFRPHIAICLNITPDHLDRYPDMDEYVYFKKIIFRNQVEGDFALVNDDDHYLKTIEGKAARVGFSFSAPTTKDGAFIRDSRVWFQGSIEGKGPRLPEGKHISRGLQEDMLASALTARLLGIEPEVPEEIFAGFKGIHHRFEYVATVKGITFIDDSKATNVGALDTALMGMEGPVIIILGGKDKGGDFTAIARQHRDKIRRAIVIGEAADRIMGEMTGIVETAHAGSMDEAVRMSFESAKDGDTVLLSPGCASFDMFRSYAHRGDVFRECVNAIK